MYDLSVDGLLQESRNFDLIENHSDSSLERKGPMIDCLGKIEFFEFSCVEGNLCLSKNLVMIFMVAG